MQINNFQNPLNRNFASGFYGSRFFSTLKEINNKGLSEDSFQKTEKIIDIDALSPAKKSEILKKTDSDDIYLQTEQIQELIELLKENSNMTLDTDKNLFEGISQREYDIPKVMLILARNSIAKSGNAYVFGDKTPHIFKGINKKEIADKLTEVINKVFWEFPRDKSETGKFKIRNKQFFIQEKGSGFVGRVYKIFDEDGNSAAIKYYSMNLPDNNGLAEIATLRQMTKDGVKNTPEFYMANAADYFTDDKNKTYNQKCWMLYEYIDKKTPVKKQGTDWKKWCKNYGLTHSDSKGKRQHVGKYLVDIGGISHDKYSLFKNRSRKYDYLKQQFREGKTVQDVLDELN